MNNKTQSTKNKQHGLINDKKQQDEKFIMWCGVVDVKCGLYVLLGLVVVCVGLAGLASYFCVGVGAGWGWFGWVLVGGEMRGAGLWDALGLGWVWDVCIEYHEEVF